MPLTEEDYKQLRRPFAPEAVKFRIAEKTKDGKKVRILTYIDSRLAVERISAVDFGWSGYPQILGGSYNNPSLVDAIKAGLPIVYELTVKGTLRADVGQISPAAWGENKGEFVADEKHAKMAVSDALKRSAVLFGVGSYLYCLGDTYAVVGEHTDPSGKYLSPAGKRYLRDEYRKKISKDAFVSQFGLPLGHGEELVVNDSSAATVADERSQATEAVEDSGSRNDSVESTTSDEAATANNSQDDAYSNAIGDLAEAVGRSREAAVLFLNSKKNKKVIVKNKVKKLVENDQLSLGKVESILRKHGLNELVPNLATA